MSEIIVIGYPDPATAEAARDEMFGISPEDRLPFSQMSEAVVATRDEMGRIKLSHLIHLWPLKTGAGLLWGLLVGGIFLHPIFGLVGGAAAGLLAGGLADCGLDDEFVKAVSGLLQPGKAALILRHEYSESSEFYRQILEVAAARGGEILRTNLAPAADRELRRAIRQAYRQPPSENPLASGS
jgi:uncharacterized membrane protein